MNFTAYFKKFERFEAIPKDKINGIVALAQKGNVNARNQIICTHQKFILSTAKKFGLLNHDMSESAKEDILSAGNVGLLNAIRLFDESKGAPFLACAEFSIRNALYENANAQKYFIHLPSNKAKFLNTVKKAISAFEFSSSKEAFLYAAEITGTSVEKIREALSWEYSVSPLMVSSDSSSDSDEFDLSDRKMSESYEYSETVEENFLASERHSCLSKALKTLSDREQKIIIYHTGFCGKELSLTEIGEKLNLTKQRVQQIEKAAYKKLRTGNCAKYLEGLCA